MAEVYIVPNKIGIDPSPFFLGADSFLDPPHTFPPLKLEGNLAGVHILEQVEEDVPHHRFARAVVALVNLY